MAHHVSRGDDVRCVVLTHGARVHDAVISDAMFHEEEVPDRTRTSEADAGTLRRQSGGGSRGLCDSGCRGDLLFLAPMIRSCSSRTRR